MSMQEQLSFGATGERHEALSQAITNGATLGEVEKLYASYILARHDGNKCHAAKALGVDRRTLQRWEKQRQNKKGI